MDEENITRMPGTFRQLGDPRESDATWTLLPAAPGVCSQCAVDHEPELPHSQLSLHYQYAFHAEHGRFPTWEDAAAHCSDEIYEQWREGLAKHGIDVAPRED